MMTRAKPILATAAIALSLAACQWMGSEDKASRPTGTAGMSGGEAPGTPTAQRYPSASAQQAQAVSPDLLQRVQQRLGQRGYDVGPVDGMWGESTQAALRNFQRDQGLQQSGQIDRQTLAALGIQPTGQQAQAGQRQFQQQPQQRQFQQPPQQPQFRQQEPYRPTTQRGEQQGMMRQGGQQPSQQQSMSPDIVRDIQQSLEEQGYDVGRVDGIWGPNTRQALSNFQQDQNLRSTGRIDQQTLAALGIAQSQQTGQAPAQSDDTNLQRRQRQEQEQLGEVPPVEQPGEEGRFEPEPEPDIGPAEQPQ